ncbi:hypothetical protein FRC12_011652 [Ceratobasidium sp. 428]|nr:hypothetical protein FRC12_011652 [Ceratobasidium sp. 428]
MSLFGRGPGFTLGEFFQFLLDPETALTESESAMLTSWLEGRTNTGFIPVDTVAVINFTDLAPQSDTPLYLDKYPHKAKILPSSSSYRERFTAREGSRNFLLGLHSQLWIWRRKNFAHLKLVCPEVLV